jgi:hypothetical protein
VGDVVHPAETSSGDLDAAFRAAMVQSLWAEKQEPKVLAIFWKARRAGMGPITAKVAASLGRDLGLDIRHENVRKVVRSKLEGKIEQSAVPDSQPTTFAYELNDAGEEYFVERFLLRASSLG